MCSAKMLKRPSFLLKFSSQRRRDGKKCIYFCFDNKQMFDAFRNKQMLDALRNKRKLDALRNKQMFDAFNNKQMFDSQCIQLHTIWWLMWYNSVCDGYQ